MVSPVMSKSAADIIVKKRNEGEINSVWDLSLTDICILLHIYFYRILRFPGPGRCTFLARFLGILSNGVVLGF